MLACSLIGEPHPHTGCTERKTGNAARIHSSKMGRSPNSVQSAHLKPTLETCCESRLREGEAGAKNARRPNTNLRAGATPILALPGGNSITQNENGTGSPPVP